ncbi:MAG: GntR family transcriptional regulator [Caldilineales bacterium]|nr:GntR family transcriptional regulator [Caldilineales bacterium]
MLIVNDTPQPSINTGSFDLASPSQAILLRDMAYQRIKDAIRLTEFKPGEHLSETRLSKQLGISRTPVREALQVLAQEGLVNIVPGRAVTVADPSPQEVMDTLYLRLLLEPEVARLAARDITEQQLDTMRKAVVIMQESTDPAQYRQWCKADTVFHETLAEACPNRLLGELSMQTCNRIFHISLGERSDYEFLLEYTRQHSAILDCISEGDSHGAEEAMREHITTVRDGVFQRMTKHYT